MNKNDIILIIIVVIICSLLFFIPKETSNQAFVYYENKLIQTIDLTKNNDYIVNGYNGEIKLNVKNGKIKVVSENSNYHYCSKQDYTNSGSIICLPNRIVIEMNNDIDTVVK